MPAFSPQAFAEHWIDAWNRRDVEAVLSWFAENVTFTSPKATVETGSPTVHGKAALRTYWLKALEGVESLEFILDSVSYDAERRTLVILYTASRDDRMVRACEISRFDAHGQVTFGEALYGAML
ncbi:MAG: nuclear transport factor 2 family protein [Magnetococcales bacterium]|nr:nuclear transport factor 2 family protein [Magnetococcales bacterium]